MTQQSRRTRRRSTSHGKSLFTGPANDIENDVAPPSPPRRYIVWCHEAQQSLRAFREAREKIGRYLIAFASGDLEREDRVIVEEFLQIGDREPDLYQFSYMAIHYAERLEDAVRSREKLRLQLSSYRIVTPEHATVSLHQ